MMESVSAQGAITNASNATRYVFPQALVGTGVGGNELQLKWGESVKAVVSLEGEVTEAEIIAYARERLAAYKCPKTVDVVDELPRNPTGKILKKDLRQPHWEKAGRKV